MFVLSLHDIFHTYTAQYSLFVLKVPLNTNQLLTNSLLESQWMYSALCFLWHIYLFVEWQWWWDDGDGDDDGGDVLVVCRARRLMTTMTA